MYSSPISWRSKRQNMVFCWNNEAGYRAIANTAMKLRWFRSLLHDMGINVLLLFLCIVIIKVSLTSPPIMYFMNRTKHIIVGCHLVTSKITLSCIHPKDQIVDLFTKGETTAHFWQFLSKLSLFYPTWVWGEVLRDSWMPTLNFQHVTLNYTTNCLYWWPIYVHKALMLFQTKITNFHNIFSSCNTSLTINILCFNDCSCYASSTQFVCSNSTELYNYLKRKYYKDESSNSHLKISQL